jgi:magnesium-transporting ATPase (P-type)
MAKKNSIDLTPEQLALLQQYGSSLEGLTTDQATAQREKCGEFNVVAPPIQCPAWVCCLLPCIKHIESMKVYRAMKPEDAEVKRDGRWIRYDASSLVPSDLIRIEEGDIVPADCIVLHLENNHNNATELLVDQRYYQSNGNHQLDLDEDDDENNNNNNPRSARIGTFLLWGSHIVLGSALAIVTATGSKTRVAKLIRDKQFPPSRNHNNVVVVEEILLQQQPSPKYSEVETEPLESEMTNTSLSSRNNMV